jgi:hypothetical protein
MPLKDTFKYGLLPGLLFLAVGGIAAQYKQRMIEWVSRDANWEVMSGKCYTANALTTLDDGEHFYFAITTGGDCEPLVRYVVEGASTALVTIYEDAEIEGGVHVDALNMRRSLPDHSPCVVHTPTINEQGNAGRYHVLPGGKETGGGALSPRTPFMLKKNTTYLLDLLNDSGEDGRTYVVSIEAYEG